MAVALLIDVQHGVPDIDGRQLTKAYAQQTKATIFDRDSYRVKSGRVEACTTDDSGRLMTYALHVVQARPCVMDAQIQKATGNRPITMFDMYGKYWRPFGLLLTEMEKEGMTVNRCVMQLFCTPSTIAGCD